MKTIIKRSASLFLAVLLSVSALAVWTPGRALAATRTWDGGGVDNKWSTAANWSDDTAPVNGDVVTIDISVAEDYNEELENDIENLSLAGINTTGTPDGGSFNIVGNGITLTGPVIGTGAGVVVFETDVTLGANVTVSGDVRNVRFGDFDSDTTLDLATYNLTYNSVSDDQCDVISTIYSALKGSGQFIVSGNSAVNLRGEHDGYTGDVTVGGKGLAVYPGALGGESAVAVNGTASLKLITGENATTYAMPVAMNSSADPSLSTSFVGFGCGGGGGPEDYPEMTLSGSLTLSRDTVFSGTNNLKVTGTYTSNGHTLSTKSGSQATITTSEGTSDVPEETVTIAADDKQPSKSEYVGNKQTYIIDGERGHVSVGNGGLLKGIGTVSNISAQEGSRIAPGHSPGGMTVLESLVLAEGSVYEVELMDQDNYDQLVVGENYSFAGSAVSLNDAILEGVISDGFNILASDTYVIIDNMSDTDVSGTFKDLPEGATFKISDGVFKITYVGGDGNDVVLSVVSVPTVPSSGFKLLLASPYVVLAATLAVAGAAYYLSRRYAFAKARA